MTNHNVASEPNHHLDPATWNQLVGNFSALVLFKSQSVPLMPGQIEDVDYLQTLDPNLTPDTAVGWSRHIPVKVGDTTFNVSAELLNEVGGGLVKEIYSGEQDGSESHYGVLEIVPQEQVGDFQGSFNLLFWINSDRSVGIGVEEPETTEDVAADFARLREVFGVERLEGSELLPDYIAQDNSARFVEGLSRLREAQPGVVLNITPSGHN